MGVVPLNEIVASVPFITMVPLPGALPVVCWMPPVTVAAGSNAEWKLPPTVSVPVTANWAPFVCTIWNCPEKVPLPGNVKFTLTFPFASVVSDVTLEQLGRLGSACG